MYFLANGLFPVFRPNTEMSGQEYNDFIGLSLKIYLLIVALVVINKNRPERKGKYFLR